MRRDTEVWSFAAEQGFTIVSKDTDFYQRSVLLGGPPKVVWLRVGNCTVAESSAMLRERYVEVRRFLNESTANFLVLSRESAA